MPISFSHLTVTWPDGTPCFTDLTGTFSSHFTGLVGANGSGKSTLLKLLMRFYDVHSGSIRMGDRKLSGINTNELRDMESYVTQETCLFHDSIANNIAIAKPGASREEIVEAAKKASLHEFIESLPNGYDTLVGELGDCLLYTSPSPRD